MDLTRGERRRILELRLHEDPVSGPRSAGEIGRIVGRSEATVRRFLHVAGVLAIREIRIERVLELTDSEG